MGKKKSEDTKYLTSEEHDRQFRERVFPAETEYLRKRWQKAYEARDEMRQEREDRLEDRPVASNGLVGLAFSGGGIRSATFNLGVAQSLHRRGVLDHVDYMSTVSGGGYLGSSVTTIMRDGADFPYAVQEGPTESAYLTWLRNHSNYLAERGLVDYFRMLAILVRGIVLNFLIIVPFLLALALLLDWHYAAPAPESSQPGFAARGILTLWESQAGESQAGESQAGESEAAEGGVATSGEESEAEGGAVAAAGDEIGAAAAKEPARARYRDAYQLTPWVAGLLLFWYLFFPVLIKVFKVLQHDATAGNESSVGSRNALELSFSYLVLAVGGVALLESLPVLLHLFHEVKESGVRDLLAGGAGLGSIGAVALFGRLLQQMKGATQKVVMLAVGLIGMLLPLIFVLYVSEVLVWEWHELLVSDPAWSVFALFLGLVVGGAAAAVLARLTGRIAWTEKGIGAHVRTGFAALVCLAGIAAPFLLLRQFQSAEGGGTEAWGVLRWILCVLLTWAGLTLLEWLTAKSKRLRTAWGGRRRYLVLAILVVAVFFAAMALVPAAKPAHSVDPVFLGGAEPPTGVNPFWFVFALALIVWFFTWISLDINLTAFHGLYRDRLAEAYLVGVDLDKHEIPPDTPLGKIPVQKVDIEGDIDLHDICQDGSKAPYHLVNVAHNLQGSGDPGVRERSSDFFIFSKRFYGGNRTGYCSTQELERVFPQMDLATAMATSAAAAAPNMGKNTNRMLVALMTLLNVRLGYWVPNPRRLAEWVRGRIGRRELACPVHRDKKSKTPGRCQVADNGQRCGRELAPVSKLSHRFFWRIPARLLFAELNSKPDEIKPWVNLSDGGHLENLAVYELLRRRCKYIIAGDGEGDPGLTFGGLATLKRFAFIDMGIEIDFNLDDLRLDEHTSYQHAAVGRIRYPAIDDVVGEETGWLLYIKLSVTGDEDEVVNEYRANNEAFPHQSTGDQFFDEGQFEAYRNLGFHVAEGLFEDDSGFEQRIERYATDETPPADPGRPTGSFEAWMEDQLRTNLAPRMAAENLFLDLQSDLAEIARQLQEPAAADYFHELHPELAKPATGWEGDAAEPARKVLHIVSEQLRLMENVYVSLDLERSRNWNSPGNRSWRGLFELWSGTESFRQAYPAVMPLHRKDFAEFCRKRLKLEAKAA